MTLDKLQARYHKLFQRKRGLESASFEMSMQIPKDDVCKGDKSFEFHGRRLCSYAIYGHSVRCKYQADNDHNPAIRDCMYFDK